MSIDRDPGRTRRVVTVGFTDHDAVLALGVKPVGVRDWFGDQPNATWPWAHDELERSPTSIELLMEILKIGIAQNYLRFPNGDGVH